MAGPLASRGDTSYKICYVNYGRGKLWKRPLSVDSVDRTSRPLVPDAPPHERSRGSDESPRRAWKPHLERRHRSWVRPCGEIHAGSENGGNRELPNGSDCPRAHEADPVALVAARQLCRLTAPAPEIRGMTGLRAVELR